MYLEKITKPKDIKKLSNDEIINCELGTIEFNNHGRNIKIREC